MRDSKGEKQRKEKNVSSLDKVEINRQESTGKGFKESPQSGFDLQGLQQQVKWEEGGHKGQHEARPGAGACRVTLRKEHLADFQPRGAVRNGDRWKVKLEIKGTARSGTPLPAMLMSWILSYR